MSFGFVSLHMKGGLKAATPQMSKHPVQKLENALNTVGFGPVLGDFWEWYKKSGLCSALDVVKKQDNSRIGYLYNCYLDGGMNKAELKLKLIEKQQSFKVARKGRCLVICGLDNILVFVLFCFVLISVFVFWCSDVITECFCFFSLHHGHRENLSDVGVL